MGPNDVEYGVDQIDSIVLGAAENAAQKARIVLPPSALDYLLKAARPRLDEANERGELEAHRKEAERSTQLLVQEIISLRTDKDSEVTSGLVGDALDRLCEKFPKLYPFCPRP